MLRAANATGGHVYPPGIGFRIGDELGNGGCRYGRVYLHDQRKMVDPGYRSEVTDEVEIEFFVQSRIDRIGRQRKKKRVPVRQRLRDKFGTDNAAGARTIIDDNLPTHAQGEG